MPRPTAAPAFLLPLIPRDALRAQADRLFPKPAQAAADPLRGAIDWLCLSHDVTGRRGSSKGYSLLRGWMPAYPETTGYILGTLLEYSERAGNRPDLVQRAREMGDWEVEVQEPDGGIMSGALSTVPRRSVVFNTGQVLHGWVDLLERGHPGYDDAAGRAAGWLTEKARDDGTWRPEAEYEGLPHTYNARVAWAMLRYARLVGAADVEDAARRQLDWTASRQRPNGWFEDCVFKTGTSPSTHAIAYTLRGLLESHVMTGEGEWLSSVIRASEVLIRKLEVHDRLPATYLADWAPSASYSCLTGTVQLGGVWLRLYQVTGDPRWLNAGLKAIDQVVDRQERAPAAPFRGAIAGSFPIWGKYAPLQYPNWATKFFADALMIRDGTLTS